MPEKKSMITFIFEKSVEKKETSRGCDQVKGPYGLRWVVRSLLLIFRWFFLFLPAVSSHPLSDGRPQLASCFSLTNGNFTVLHQSVVFTSLFLLSAVPELTVRLQQHCGSRTGVCWRSLWVWHHFMPLLHCAEKKIGLPTLTLESDFCTRDSIFECVLLNPYILFSVFWLFFVTPFPCSVYLLWFNAASFFLSLAVLADEMATSRYPRIRRTKGFSLSDTWPFSK